MLDRVEKWVGAGVEIAVEGLRIWIVACALIAAWAVWRHPEVLRNVF